MDSADLPVSRCARCRRAKAAAWDATYCDACAAAVAAADEARAASRWRWTRGRTAVVVAVAVAALGGIALAATPQTAATVLGVAATAAVVAGGRR